MEGWGSGEVASNAIEAEIKTGGDYYSYVEKLDAPEKEREKLIHAYEKAYIDEMVQMDEEYPGDKGRAEKDAWIEKKMALVDQFKEEHPDYPELARKHAAENARKARGEA